MAATAPAVGHISIIVIVWLMLSPIFCRLSLSFPTLSTSTSWCARDWFFLTVETLIPTCGRTVPSLGLARSWIFFRLRHTPTTAQGHGTIHQKREGQGKELTKFDSCAISATKQQPKRQHQSTHTKTDLHHSIKQTQLNSTQRNATQRT